MKLKKIALIKIYHQTYDLIFISTQGDRDNMKRTHAIDNDEVNKTILLPQLFRHLQPATDTKQGPSLEPKT